MSNETVLEKLTAALEAVGYRLEAINPEVKQGGRFKPRDDEEYWSLSSGGQPEKGLWGNDELDKTRYIMGNCYRTKEEAESARDKQLALVRVQDKLEELTDVPLDWDGVPQYKSVLYYSWEVASFDTHCVEKSQGIGGLFGSKPACDWVIHNMKSDLKLIAGIL